MENYSLLMQKTIDEIIKSGIRPRLLLHSCCAPCSSSVLLSVMPYFDITLFYYNPNIAPKKEYIRRRDEQIFLLSQEAYATVKFIEGDYEPTEFFSCIKGQEAIPEGGERCFSCYRLRLEAAAKYAENNGFDYFTTTLSVSPHKKAERLNLIGAQLEQICSVKYLYSDFKKNDGYKKSLELSAKYGLYRQDYCGCGLS